MNFADELLLTYRARSPDARAFLLSQLLDLPAGDSAEALVELLWQEVRAEEPGVRRQARYVLGQYLPRQTARAYGFGRNVPGVWSAYLQLADDAPVAGLADAELPSRLRRARRALAPLAERLGRLTANGSAGVKSAASLALAPLAGERALEALAPQFGGARLSTTAAFVAGEVGGAAARAVLGEAIRKHGRAHSWLVLLLRACPGPEVVRWFEKLVDRLDADGRAAMAEALATFPAEAARPLVVRLLGAGEPWVAAHALDTAAALGDPALAGAVEGALRSADDGLRALAVLAVGATGGAASRLESFLADPSPAVQAAALQALAGAGLPADRLGALAPLLTATAPAVRARAVLLGGRHDAEWGSDALAALVLDRDPRARLEGVHALGYLHGEGAAELLERIAQLDGQAAVRRLAARGLARLDLTDGLPGLLRLASTSDLPVLAELGAAFADLPAGSARLALEVVGASVGGSRSIEEREALLPALGGIAAAAGRGLVDGLADALRSPAERVVIAGLEGVCRLGDALPADAVRPLARHAAPRVRARAALALMLAGEPEGAELAAAMLDGASEEEARAACQALLVLGHLLPAALVSPRYARLTAWLSREPAPAAPAPAAAGASFPLPERPRAVALEQPLRRAPRAVASRGADGLTARYVRVAGAAAGWGAALRASLAWPRNLMWAPLVVIGLVCTRGPAPAPGELPVVHGPSVAPGQLAVVSVEGEVQRKAADGETSPLRAGMRVAPGDRVETAAGGRARLADAPGNSVALGSASSLALAAPAGAGSFLIQEPRGDVALDLRRGGESEVRTPLFGLMLTRAAVDIARDDAAVRLTLRAGAATAYTAGGALLRLKVGVPLDVTQPEAPPAAKARRGR